MTKSSARRTLLLKALVLFQGLSGLFGGIALILDPTGGILQIPITILDESLLNDFLIPGVILVSVLGLYPMIVFLGLIKNQSWALAGTKLLGLALIVWIAVEIIMVGYQSQPPLQLIYGLIGILLLAVAQWTSNRSTKTAIASPQEKS